MEFSTLNGYKVKDKKAIRYYDTVADMKADTTLKNGMHVKTKGYYSVNDGGDSEYHITSTENLTEHQESLNNNLYATLIIQDKVNIKQFGAKGDDVNDDTTSIQNAIDYSYDNNIKEVFIPFGTYKITKPLFLYTDMKIFGDNSNSSIIHKSTSTKSDVTGYDIDAIIILTNRELNSSNQSSRQEIDNIQLVGNVSEYVENKVDKQYAIYSKVYSPKIKITNFLINKVDYGIYTPSMYTGLIQNCVGLEAHYGAIASYTESQGVSISNINTTGSHEFGIKLSGGSYSTLSNILVEWNYGNICYDLQFYRGNMINCGAELGSPGFNTAIRLINSNVTLDGGTLACNRNNENLKMFDLDNSSLKIENVNFGQTTDLNPYVGIFANITNKSSLIISKGCKFTSAFNGGVTRSGANNSITIEDTKINLTTAGGVSSIAGSSNVYEGEVVEFINNKILNLPIKVNSIYSGFTTSQNTNNSQNIEYYKSFNKGDIGIYDNPTVNGSAMWLCNKNNASLEEPQTVGTISSISGSTMILTNVNIENYATNGYRLFPYCTIKGATSGITKTLIGVSYANNTLYFNDATNLDQFQIGEHIAISPTPYVRNGDYLHIPIINAGESSQRPTQNVVNGTMFFDTTLGKPIWYNHGHWVDSSGTQV